MMYARDLRIRSPFKDLFPIRDEVLKEIVKDMKKNGYDHTRPIVLWQGHKFTVLDGHTRLKAAELADVFEVPVEVKSFQTEEEALEYVIHCQRSRRNLSDQEILQCVSELDKRKKAGRPSKKKLAQPCANFGKSSESTAQTLGVSNRKVEQARTVLNKAPDEIKKAVKAGKMSINKAYNKTVNPYKGSPESLKKAADEIGNVKKVLNIVKKRLSKEEIQELIKLLQENI
jgi:ParB family chromosome partitioning protein